MPDTLPKNLRVLVRKPFQRHPSPISTRDDIIIVDPNAYDAVHFVKRKKPYVFVWKDGTPEYFCAELSVYLHNKTVASLINLGFLRREEK